MCHTSLFIELSMSLQFKCFGRIQNTNQRWIIPLPILLTLHISLLYSFFLFLKNLNIVIKTFTIDLRFAFWDSGHESFSWVCPSGPISGIITLPQFYFKQFFLFFWTCCFFCHYYYFFNWRIIALHNSVIFCHPSTRISMSSLKKCLFFRSFFHFLIGLFLFLFCFVFFLVLSCMSCLYILEINSL